MTKNIKKKERKKCIIKFDTYNVGKDKFVVSTISL